MHGRDLIAALKKKFGARSIRELARTIGGSGQVLRVVERQKFVSVERVCGMIDRSLNQGREAAANEWISEIVEFHPIKKTKSRGEKRWEILDRYDGTSKRSKHLISALESQTGIYLFYDSMGRVIYVGKTKSRNLWREMKSAFNRKNVANVIYRARHSQRSSNLLSISDKRQKIIRETVPMHETAAYFSAYNVSESFIDQTEALLIRAIPNNLINVRIEGQTRRSS